MIPLEEIRCLALEDGATINFITHYLQPAGQEVIQAKVVRADCSRKYECPFLKKYGRCPNREEFDAKYSKAR